MIKSRGLLYFVCLILLITINACSSRSNSGSSFQSTTVTPDPEQVTFSGAGIMGIFDPAVAKDSATGTLWMSYSSVEPTSYASITPQIGVGIRLASSTDGGSTWTDAGVDVVTYTDILGVLGPLSSIDSALDIAAGSTGTWMSETSTLVYDPAADPSERWKIMWHQYLLVNPVSYFVDYAWIAYKTAATPADLATAPTIKLFGGFGLNMASESTTSPAYSPVAGAPMIALNTALTPDMSTCAYGEPGLMATSDALYLSLSCGLLGDPIDTFIVLLKCASPCNITSASSWQYLGKLATETDAADIGHDKYGAPQLVEKNGAFYLIVTPINVVGTENVYDGCRVYQFSDINSASLLNSSGVLTEIARVDGVTGTHNGACTDHESLSDGILYSQFVESEPAEKFKIFQSFETYP